MAHPKSRVSKQRKRKRRTHYKIEAPQITSCSSCGAPTLRHRICGACGSYRGRTIINKTKGVTVESTDSSVDDVQVID